MCAVQKQGVVFTIKTDYKPLKYQLEADWTYRKIQQWALKLSRYNCNVPEIYIFFKPMIVFQIKTTN